ncbi:MAG: hypothetical protein PHE33_11735, partial [Bacteroidales bacterium]|nr:hypothetical protein [Bacteroidales bacterium]
MNAISNENFSLGTKYRFLNHLMFWVAYILFSATVFHFGNSVKNYYSYFSALTIDFVSIYIILLVLIPRFIQKNYQLLKFFLYLILLISINFAINFGVQNYVIAD